MGELPLNVQGYIDIQAKLINNARVTAGLSSADVMKLSTYAKSGSGEWSSQGGTLEVNVAVSGAGTWMLGAADSAKIEINSACQSLTGDVAILRGTLDVDENFCTTGDLTFGDVTSPYPDAYIKAANNKSAKMGGTCP